MGRRKQRTRELRDRLLHAALALLDEGGVDRLTTRGVAEAAGTSAPAVYELFGDKAGLVRAVFFEGFTRLGDDLAALPPSASPADDLRAAVGAFRRFALARPALAAVMFQRPVADFEPGPEQLAAAGRVREHLVDILRRCVAAGLAAGDPVDLAHLQLAAVQGLAIQEAAGWLGRSRASIERRWALAATIVLHRTRGAGPA